ncbi:MAG TPA: hypothetical protein VGD24_02605 [Gallionella sp.]
MSAPVSIHEVRQAQLPHNLFIAGLFVFDLLMTPAIIGLKIGMIGMLIPLLCSVSLIAYLHLRGRRRVSAFVDAHWQLACKRGRLLMLGYAISAALILLAWLVSLTARDASMEHIMWIALTRVALVPTLIFVMITAVLEFSAYAQASKRELPGKATDTATPPA